MLYVKYEINLNTYNLLRIWINFFFLLKVGKIIFVLNKNIKAFKTLYISKYVKKSKEKIK